MKRALVIIGFYVFISCKEEKKVLTKPIKKNLDVTELDEKPYFLENITDDIYELGATFKYSFQFTPSKIGVKNAISNADVKKIDFINVKVVNHGNTFNIKPALEYSYPPKGICASSLVIENDSMVWIHPPRRHFFKILEINPFPCIRKNTVNNQWNDSLIIGSQYADERWAIWNRNLINRSTYKIQKDTLLNTSFGLLKCKVIHAVSQNKIGRSSLVSYFNDTYGFVLLNYKNIDNSRLILTLKDYKKKARKLKVFEIAK